ncbi:hypothetical protein DBT48_01985 [Aerococcus mictus]|uniref:hypothetical protein n=1 Tax=Aerococcus mictus TaxID=2976810 RepID=UPI000DCE0E0A|nr:hypothetical protein [Aerococcus mictus]RAV75068.1 hypothetical protein DBT48_01985 [Aerococcus mictus]
MALLTLEEDLSEEVKEYFSYKGKALDLINQLDKDSYVDILYMRYFEYKDYKEIAYDLDQTYEWTIRQHGYALQGLDAIMPSEEK